MKLISKNICRKTSLAGHFIITIAIASLVGCTFPGKSNNPKVIQMTEKQITFTPKTHALDNWYDALKNDDNPYFYFIYNAFAANKLNMEKSIRLLQDNALG